MASGGLAVSAEAAGNREIPVSLSQYCKSLKLHFAGFNKKTKKFTCAVQATGFNTWYYTKHSNINLTSVCRKYHKTDKWRFRGSKVWCIVEPRGVDLTLCNRFSEPVWTAIGYHVKPDRRRGGEQGWVTQGWWQIKAGKCRTLWRKKDYSGSVYIHGMKKADSLAASDTRLCVHYGKVFKIGRADKFACNAPNQERVGMHKLVVRTGANRWNFR